MPRPNRNDQQCQTCSDLTARVDYIHSTRRVKIGVKPSAAGAIVPASNKGSIYARRIDSTLGRNLAHNSNTCCTAVWRLDSLTGDAKMDGLPDDVSLRDIEEHFGNGPIEDYEPEYEPMDDEDYPHGVVYPDYADCEEDCPYTENWD